MSGNHRHLAGGGHIQQALAPL